MARDYTKIIAWQRAHRLALDVYRVSQCFPKAELFGLTSQLRRAAYSVPANIDEGSGRASKRDYLHFLSIAGGSLRETEYFLLLARDLGYLSGTQHQALEPAVNGAFAPLSGLQKAVGREAGKVRSVLALLTSVLLGVLGGLAVWVLS